MEYLIKMDIFDQIFAGLVFLRDKTVNSYTFYVASIQTFIGNGQKYVILLVPFNKAYHEKAKIYQLAWVSLQTRILQERFQVPDQTLDHKTLDHRYSENKIKLTVKNRTSVQTDYFCPLPIELSILHDPKKKSMYQWPDTMELRQALNTFQCVIKLLN